MRVVLRYENGRTIWSENTPAQAWSTNLGGSAIQDNTRRPDPNANRKKVAEKLRGEGGETA